MPVLRFHLLTIDHEFQDGTVIVTITTNAACHLYLRYSDVFPRIHRKGVERRGLVIGWDARYCFAAYQHIEQDEEGDTWTHTFTWPGWENCNTRYFYFWGTMGGQDMVSETPIFWIHYLWPLIPGGEAIFYPILDGWAGRDSAGTWAQVHAGIGTYADYVLTDARTSLASHPFQSKWSFFARSIILFDTTSLPPIYGVVSAKLDFISLGGADALGIAPAINVFRSAPLSNSSIVPADYLRLFDVPLATQIEFADWPAEGNLATFTLNAAGLSAIHTASITKLGLREANFDAPDIDPLAGAPPNPNKASYMFVYTTEKGTGFVPKLTINEGL